MAFRRVAVFADRHVRHEERLSVAGFWALNGHRPPFLVYANATDYRVFTPENAPELRDDFLHDVMNDIILQCKTTENILRAASTKDELLGLVA